LSTIYLIALTGVSLALLGALAESVWSLTRNPVWSEPRQFLRAVTTMDRRQHPLPYVGVERRRAAAQAQAKAAVEKLAA
jgi:hypothetical protein